MQLLHDRVMHHVISNQIVDAKLLVNFVRLGRFSTRVYHHVYHARFSRNSDVEAYIITYQVLPDIIYRNNGLYNLENIGTRFSAVADMHSPMSFVCNMDAFHTDTKFNPSVTEASRE